MSALSFTAKKLKNPDVQTGCAILPIYKGAKLTGAAQALDAAGDGYINRALKLGDFAGEPGESLMLPGAGKAARVLLLGCGEQKKYERATSRDLASKLSTALGATKSGDALLHLDGLSLDTTETLWLLQHLAKQLVLSSYRYTATVSKPKPAKSLKRVTVNVATLAPAAAANRSLQQGKAVGLGMNDTRELADLPGNICTPSYLAQQARKLARQQTKLKVSVLEEKKMKELGMGALLSVSAGSKQAAKLIVLNYSGGKRGESPHVLVGKGITFDSGGISLKPGAKMDEMKYDMGGAASVLGTMRTALELELPINIVGIIAAAENMPSGIATKPGDVVTSMSGKTIEVLNTDAEGRLVLCDALTYAARFKPATVIDIATLTGACIVALGSHATALYANEETLAEQLLSAGNESHDRAWRMPLWDDYQRQLKSQFADIANIGGPSAGSVTAACFLARFTKDYHWAHLDIAGSAWNSAPKGATGRPVALLSRFLMDRAGL